MKEIESPDIPWHVIASTLNKTAGAEEKKQLQAWLDSAPGHADLFEELALTWSLTGHLPAHYGPALEDSWEKLLDRINRKSRQKSAILNLLRYSAAAAVLALVFLAGLKLGGRQSDVKKAVTTSRVIAPKGSKTRIVLPDSSKVWLNSGAEIWYTSGFTPTSREVWTKGECFFDVEEDPAHPFVVHGSVLSLKVLGTAFNFREEEDGNLSSVTLLHGSVKVLNRQLEPISELVPGQEYIYTNGVGKVQTAVNADASTAWINNMLIFKNQPFEEVIHYLSGWYGVNIRLDKSLYYRHNYTFKVKTESLREVLELVSIMTPIDYTVEGEQVTIKYKPKKE